MVKLWVHNSSKNISLSQFYNSSESTMHEKLSFMYEFYFTEWNFQSVKLISNWPFLCCEVSNILLTVQIIRVSTIHSRKE